MATGLLSVVGFVVVNVAHAIVARAFLLSGDRRMKKYRNFMAAISWPCHDQFGCRMRRASAQNGDNTSRTAAAEHGHEHAEGEGEHGTAWAGPHDGHWLTGVAESITSNSPSITTGKKQPFMFLAATKNRQPR